MRDQTSLLNIGDYRGLVPVLFDASKYVGAYAANKFSQRAAAASVAPTVVGAAKAASSNWFLPWMIGDAGAGVALKALWKQPWDYKQLLDFNSTDPSWFLTEGHDLGNYRTGSHVGLGYDSRGVPRLFHFNDGRYQAWNKGDVVSNGTLNPRIYYKPNNGAGNSVYAVPDEAEIRQALAGYPGVADHIIANMNDEGYGPYNNILRTSIPTSGDLYYGSGNREFKINLAPNRSAQNNEIHRLGLKRYVDSTVTNNLNARINDLVNLHRRLTAPPSDPKIERRTGSDTTPDSDTTPEQPEFEFGPPRMRTPSRF